MDDGMLIDSEMQEGGATNPALGDGFVNPSMLSLVNPEPHLEEISPPLPLPLPLPLPTDVAVIDAPSEASADSDYSEKPDPSRPRIAWKPTGCCYDDRMAMHANPDWGPNSAHPEVPDRVRVIMKEFKDSGLIFHGSDSELKEVLKWSPTRYMYRIAARFALKSEILTVHMADQFQWVMDLQNLTVVELQEKSKIMDTGRKSLYVGPLTTQAALLAAGGAIDTCKHVMEGNVKNAIAVIRPPGHHAEATESMGFCLFNNVPIAAKICQAEYPETCRKVLILDWDVHHGNGTQNMFYGDASILYISLHVYQGGAFYPGPSDDPNVPDGGIENVGYGHAAGKNVNIGWHSQGMGDGEYMAAFQKIVMPIAQEFGPDLVIVSAGFDAAAGDELGGCFVSPACYSQMTHMLMSLANGKLAVCLEGGYNLPALRRSALAVAKTLMGEPPEYFEIPHIHYKAAEVLDQVMEAQAPYWECMRRGRAPKADILELGTARMHDVIRAYTSNKLQDKYKMLSLSILKGSAFRQFENQVLATPNIDQAKKILLILHDPPELLAYPDPLESHVQAHNAWMSDPVEPYIDWAVSQGFGVIDVNVPLFVTEAINPSTNLNGNASYQPKPTETDLATPIRELVEYIWDNYLELWDTPQGIILMGVGDSYFGVKQLLTIRDCKYRINGVLNFVSGALRPIKSETDEDLSKWYKNHSQVYVASNHACWTNVESMKKVRKKRFGTVLKSEEKSLGRMMKSHFSQATEWMAGIVDDELLGDDGGL